MRTDSKGRSRPNDRIDFDRAAERARKDGRVRYVFHDGTIHLRITKNDRLHRAYWIVSADEHCHATEPWLTQPNPVWSE